MMQQAGFSDATLVSETGFNSSPKTKGVLFRAVKGNLETTTPLFASNHGGNVVDDVKNFLLQRIEIAIKAGVSKTNIIIDPGFGFGKTLQHNLALFHGLERFVATGLPLLVGVSRKSMIGQLLDIPVTQRMPASVALAGLAAWLGAAIIRVHDVQPTVHAVRMCQAIKNTS